MSGSGQRPAPSAVSAASRPSVEPRSASVVSAATASAVATATPDHVLSPGGSDVGSATSSVMPTSSALGGAASARLGINFGAGFSSLNLALSGVSTPVGMSGFNAISTLLNDPGKRPRPIDPSSSRYPAIQASHTPLPRVKRSDFEPYMTSVKPEWERFLRNQQLGRSGKARLAAEDAEAEAAAVQLEVEKASRMGDEAAAALARKAAALGRGSVDEARMVQHRKRLPALSAVPQVFFGEDFDLANPYTFDLVTERYKHAGSMAAIDGDDGAEGGGVEGYDVALNQMLQEKLSYYSDVVEQHLILEISARSSSFFAALGSLQDLEAEASACLTRVDSLRKELETKDENEAKAALRIVRQQSKRRETRDTLAAVQAVGELVDRRDLVKLLVQSGQWQEALEVIGQIEAVMDGRKPSADSLAQAANGDEEEAAPLHSASLPPHLSIEFSAIPSIAGFRSELQESLSAIFAQLESEILAVLTSDLTDRIGRPGETLAATTSGADADAADVQGALQQEAVDGLMSPSGETRAGPLGAPGGPPSQPLASPARGIDPQTPLSGPDDSLRSRITPILQGLVRGGGMDDFAPAYRDVVLRGVREALKTYLEPSTSCLHPELAGLAALLDDDEVASGRSDVKLSPSAAAAAARLRQLNQAEFLQTTAAMYQGFTQTLAGVDGQIKALLTSLDSIARQELSSASSDSPDDAERDATATSGDGSARPPAHILQMPSSISPSLPSILTVLVHDAASLSHVFASRLQSLRASTHVTLPLGDFLAVFRQSWSFVLSSEVAAGRMIVGLRGTMLNQAKGWLANFHRARIEGGAKKVEEEMWGQAELTPQQQREVQLILDSATSDPAAFLVGTEGSLVGLGATAIEAAAEEGAEESLAKTLRIESTEFFVVGATLYVLHLLSEYVQVVINLPLLTTEAMGRVVEFLKQFNSRTCQVVLGAGAMRSAGLKNITAKHLALASQSLSIMISLTPYVRETVRRHLSPRQAVMLVEFDKLKRDFQEHQNEIHDKLIAIMSDRLTVHCRALSNLDWNTPLAAPPSEASKPIQELTKETVTLHRVLTKYLQPGVVTHVMGQVLRMIDQRVSTEMDRVEVRIQSALDRFAADKEGLDKRFGGLKHVEWNPESLARVIAGKRLPAPPTPTVTSPRVSSEVAPKGPPSYRPRISPFNRQKPQQQQQQQQQPMQSPQSPRLSQQQNQPATIPEVPPMAPNAPIAVSNGAATTSEDKASQPFADEGKTLPRQPASEDANEGLPPVPPTPPAKDQATTFVDTQAQQSEKEQPVPPIEEDSTRTSAATAAPSTPVVAEPAAPPASSPAPLERADSQQGSSVDSAPSSHTQGPAEPATPAKDSRPASAEQIKSPTTPTTPLTPSKPGRMSLRERLAEAARARAAAAGGGSGSGTGTPSRPSSSAEAPSQMGEATTTPTATPAPMTEPTTQTQPSESVAQGIDEEVKAETPTNGSGQAPQDSVETPRATEHDLVTPTAPSVTEDSTAEGSAPQVALVEMTLTEPSTEDSKADNVAAPPTSESVVAADEVVAASGPTPALASAPAVSASVNQDAKASTTDEVGEAIAAEPADTVPTDPVPTVTEAAVLDSEAQGKPQAPSPEETEEIVEVGTPVEVEAPAEPPNTHAAGQESKAEEPSSVDTAVTAPEAPDASEEGAAEDDEDEGEGEEGESNAALPSTAMSGTGTGTGTGNGTGTTTGGGAGKKKKKKGKKGKK